MLQGLHAWRTVVTDDVVVLTAIAPVRTYLWEACGTAYRITVLKQGEVLTVLDRGSHRWMHLREVAGRNLTADYIAEKLALPPAGAEARNLTLLIALATGAVALVSPTCPACSQVHRPTLAAGESNGT